MRNPENAAYEARYGWWPPARLCLAAALCAALVAGGAAGGLLTPDDARDRVALVLLAFLLVLILRHVLRRFPRALRLSLRREAAFAVTAEGVDVDPPARTPVPWERIAAIHIVTRHGRVGGGTYPWTRGKSGRRVYILGPPEEGGPPLAWREIDGWRLDHKRTAAAATRFNPAVRVEKSRVAARGWTPEALAHHLYWGDA
ncbi:hypothetical protein [Actinomadura xylanilytica]|uniref:hypothetical protein n=1 Tax=Actinomadura xylanilytica TaxID=887459 RepID=UPI00255A7A2C|nr:hypothetical protein [Actinomadura xylanilytica]MDL4777450.1 hypothetical protein [Actinomadura xylanilytica]